MRYGTINSPDVIDTTCDLVHDKYIDDYTKLLLHLDNGVVDSAKNATVTNNNVTFSTTSKFGGYSGSFNGTTAYLTAPDSENWYFGNNDFTIDCWVRFNAVTGHSATLQMIASQWDTSVNYSWEFWYYEDNGNLYFTFYNGTTSKSCWSAWSPVINTWYHVAAVRSGNSFKVYVDGVAGAGEYQSGEYLTNSTALLRIGDYKSGGVEGGFFDGYIDEVRISKGIARWTSNFTPPTQSYDCPLDTQTKLLIHGGGPNNGVTFYDNSTTARTLTTVGTAKFDTAQYKHRVSSILLDGNSDWITAPDHADWAFGTGDFTIDFWVRFNNLPTGYSTYFSQFVNGSNQTLLYLNSIGGGSYRWDFYSNSGGVGQGYFQATTALSTGTWYHFAVVRQGSSCYMFLNGTSLSVTQSTAWGTIPDLAATLYIGVDQNGSVSTCHDGWIDEYRISKGIARWTSDFTPPAAPYDSPLTQYVIDGLDGDVDKEYRLLHYAVNGYNGGINVVARFNNDSASNYGYQQIYGQSTTAGASRAVEDGIYTSVANALGYVSICDTTIYAKTGKVRTMLRNLAANITGTTIDAIQYKGMSWNNTVDNITFINFYTAGNAIGCGSRILLLKKRELTTGTKTGEIDPVGTTYGHWQLIYDNTLTAAKTNVMLTSQMDAYTKLLIHADGADASTAFYDFSNSAHAITAVGTAQVDTAQSKFGGASMLLDGNSDYLTIPDNDDWNFGSGEFTIDCWVRFNSLAAAAQGIIGQYVDDTHKWQLFYAGGYLQFYDYNAGYVFDASQAWTPSTGVWYHIAAIRSVNTITLYVDGVSIGSTAFSGSMTDYASPTLNVGLATSASTLRYFDGWIDEVRVSKGIARWTANFTPPTRAYNELDGDRNVVYKIILRGKLATGGNSIVLYPNNDSGGSYGHQRLRGDSTTVSASRNTSAGGMRLGDSVSNNDLILSEALTYQKGGFVRPMINTIAAGIAGTTVNYIDFMDSVWADTTNKVTSLVVSTGDSMLIGTHIELWKLNL